MFTTELTTLSWGSLRSLTRQSLVGLCASVLFVVLGSTIMTAQCTMSCTGQVNVSLAGPSNGCSMEITPDLLGATISAACPGTFNVILMDLQGLPLPTSPFITDVHLGGNYRYKVQHSTGQQCWGFFTVLDEAGPEITNCNDVTIFCLEDDRPSTEGGDVPAPFIDDCSNFTVTYRDANLDSDCGSPLSGKIVRTWTATDANGESSTCEQVITQQRVTLANMSFTPVCPGPVTMECSGATVNTDPSVTGYPKITVGGRQIEVIPGMNTMCELAADYDDEVFARCGGGFKILRTWTIYDWCMSTNDSRNPWTCIQQIKVEDTVAPAISCPDTIFASTTGNSCLGNITLPAATVTDLCSGFTVSVQSAFGNVTGNGGPLLNVPVGTHNLTYSAKDDCNNTAVCTAVLVVRDNVQPTAICDQITAISLNDFGTAIASANVFDDGSTDNCGVTDMQVRRMATSCSPATAFDDFVSFDCCDVDAPVMVVFRVFDAAGNSNDCMVQVNVQDKTAPRLVCPTDKTAFCDDDFADLTRFGAATAFDNCSNVTITVANDDQRDDCGVGQIYRVFTASDDSGYNSSCTQTINVINPNPFNSADISWPRDYLTSECQVFLHPDSLSNFPINYSRPVISDDACDQVAVNFSDEYLPIAAPACFKILRTWRVIDWCRFDPNASTPIGTWTHVQVIKVTDNEAPVFTSCPGDITVDSQADNCNGEFVNLSTVTATDCNPNLAYSYTIDFFDNGTTDAAGNGPNASRNYPIGKHKVTFRVQDGCTNANQCTFFVTVRDGKKPSVVCINGLSASLMATGMVTILPEMIDNGSSDNCTVQADLDYRLVPSTFTCDNIGQNVVRLYVRDLSGNEDFCETYVIIQDNMSACNGTTSLRVGGGVITQTGEPVQDVSVEANGNGVMMGQVMSDQNGDFAFNTLAQGGDYSFVPVLNNHIRNGVSTWDLVLIARHILGTHPLDSPYKIIAADVDNNRRVTASDLLEIRDVILGSRSVFSGVSSWRFIDGDFNFANPALPLADQFPEFFNINDLAADVMDLQFIGIKNGDVNNSAISHNFASLDDRNYTDAIAFEAPHQQFAAGEEVSIELNFPQSAAAKGALNGLQFTFNFDPSVLAFEGLSPNENLKVGAQNFGMNRINEGMITASWMNTDAVELTDNQLVKFSFVALEAGTMEDVVSINSRFTLAEAYFQDGTTTTGVDLKFSGKQQSSNFVLYQNQPNPFKNGTVIGFDLPESGTAQLSVFNLSGKLLWTAQQDCFEGYNSFDVNRNQLQESGILYYQVSCAGHTATRKLIIID